VTLPADRSDLSPRHWAVLGSFRFGRGPATPQTIARELDLDLREVVNLLSELERAGLDITPTRDRDR
jgi:hypothetical protein